MDIVGGVQLVDGSEGVKIVSGVDDHSRFVHLGRWWWSGRRRDRRVTRSALAMRAVMGCRRRS